MEGLLHEIGLIYNKMLFEMSFSVSVFIVARGHVIPLTLRMERVRIFFGTVSDINSFNP